MSNTITLPRRKVQRAIEHPYEHKRYYFVIQQRPISEEFPEGGWEHVSQGYAHSTSAFAALGRLVQKDTLAN